MRRHIAVRLVTLLLAAIACGALTPAAALATWVDLTPPCSFVGTLTAPAGSTPAPSCFYGFDMHVRAGQTVVATLTTSPQVHDVLFETGLDGGDYNLVSSEATPGVWVLQFAALWNDPLGILLYSSTPGTFTLDVGDIPAPAFRLGAMNAPTRAKRNKEFPVSTTLSDYNALGVPITFKVERRVKGRLRYYRTFYAYDFIRDTRPWFGYGSYLRLPRGVYRVRARFSDPAHLVPQYSKWKTITVR